MEYIGATGIPIRLDDVPIEDDIDFHFLLGFAIDSDQSGNPQNGKFSPYWASPLTPSSIADMKASHPNVKVLASLSGWSIDTCQNLIISKELTLIMKDSPEEILVQLTLLKNHSVISVATIAPFYSTAKPYLELFKAYGGVIDFVNYQFYTDKVKTPKGYLESFRFWATQFDKNKLLPSYEVKGRGIQGDAFFDALSLLERNGSFEINGIMIFSADASSSNDYYYEKKSQQYLLNSASG
ncbi:hypothetical protein FNV43_RR18868 [Rhamnella rubrinervis]|uniref:Chitinase n=1 Tax=Rhamnella rubrinervis TaxID=2594499 RepID=A0A8K0E734_9ROSA|nr:hypothetical protein FNV43_RR18868 [Rhamnella rubrinervis]